MAFLFYWYVFDMLATYGISYVIWMCSPFAILWLAAALLLYSIVRAQRPLKEWDVLYS
jgi:hypothetical protein